MWHAYRLNDQKDWVKMKDFKTLEEYQEYIIRRKIMWSKCFNDTSFELYGSSAISPVVEDNDTSIS